MFSRNLRFTFQSTLPGWGSTGSDGAIDQWVDISIHAPRMGSDVRCLLTRTGKHYFNPRSPDGERLVDFRTVGLRLEISIHAPRMGSDNGMGAVFNWLYLFQSTLPGWGATSGCDFEDPA